MNTVPDVAQEPTGTTTTGTGTGVPITDAGSDTAAAAGPDARPALLEIDGLEVDYRPRGEVVHAVRSISLRVAAGEVVAIVGESGSGKSTTAHAVLRLLPRSARIAAGRIRFDGQDVTGLSERRFRALRGRDIALIPQEPTTSLNPTQRIGAQVAEVLILHGLADRRTAGREALRVLADAGMPEPELRARQYPSQLSGGLCQRALIAVAIAAKPRLIVADEPTSALDVTVQRQILDHLSGLTRDAGTSVLLVTHDLGVAAERADRILVMTDGRIVEEGAPERILDEPEHPYTRALIAAAPSLEPRPRAAPRAAPRPAPATPAPATPAPATPAAGSPATARDVRPPAAAPPPEPPHVRVDDLVKEFRLPRSGPSARTVRAVDGVSFTIQRGRTFALVGESGSGKSTAARLVLRLTEPTSGRIALAGEDITHTRGEEQRALRRRMQIVYQNPYASLNPRFTVEQIITDPLASFGVGSRAERRQRAAELIDLVALPAAMLGRRPAELSGGQRQRVAIARALALRPELLVCDEAVSALDVSVQAQILDLLGRLQAELGVSYLFISHDLAVVRRIADEVGVMHRGRLVETGSTEAVFTGPADPYTRELLASIPRRRPKPPS
ncbi:ABC transporter ATP-binding protein [Frankia sp. Mgl5]|uniref:dipeptide ABC transporter ATP-binding protein n=1 Tax=Frankia sp. Mgl5 TaxID=2933793 RepID=UPI00200CDB07|nr:ABC transporter ATP-binding protein [Frankia sp. Mgl5]MCK9926724.1 ABC transporter ATP-binding protein [Frankia sp. Mgl5]